MIKIYTDGSCIGNPGKGGWAAIILSDGKKTEIKGSEKDTTNNQMELLAPIKALKEIPKGSKVKIFTEAKIKKGFKTSIGCNLKKYRSNHRLAPLTSTPTIGTNAKRVKEVMNKGSINLFNNEVSIIEIITIITNATIVKIKCFEKKK